MRTSRHLGPKPTMRAMTTATMPATAASGQLRLPPNQWSATPLWMVALAAAMLSCGGGAHLQRWQWVTAWRWMADQGSAGFLADTFARRLLEQSDDPVAVTGGDGRVDYANAGFCRLTGCAPDAVAGAPLAELVPGFDPLAEFQTVMLGTQRCWWEFRGARCAMGGAEEVIVVRAHDVTDHVRARRSAEDLLARERAHRSTERLQLALQAGGLGNWETDYGAGVTRCRTRRWPRCWGWRRLREVPRSGG